MSARKSALLKRSILRSVGLRRLHDAPAAHREVQLLAALESTALQARRLARLDRENEVTTVRQLEGEHLGAGRTLHLNSTFSGKYEGARGAVQNGSMLAQRFVAQQRRQIASADHRRRVGAAHQAPTRCLQCHLDLGRYDRPLAVLSNSFHIECTVQLLVVDLAVDLGGHLQHRTFANEVVMSSRINEQTNLTVANSGAQV